MKGNAAVVGLAGEKLARLPEEVAIRSSSGLVSRVREEEMRGDIG